MRSKIVSLKVLPVSVLTLAAALGACANAVGGVFGTAATAVQSISVEPPSLSVKLNETAVLKAVITPVGTEPLVVWSADGVPFGGNGLTQEIDTTVTAEPGPKTITVKIADSDILATCQVSVYVDLVISFDANGGGTPDKASKTVTPGETYGTLANVEWAGYEFAGWWTQGPGEKQVTANTAVTATVDQTLYARWTGGDSRTITFDKQGGAGGDDGVTVIPGSAGQSVSAPEKEGCVFSGYFSGTGGSGTKYYNASGAANAEAWKSNEAWSLAANATLYAGWADVNGNSYTVTLDWQGGSAAEGSGSVQAVCGSPMPETAMPTKKGYNFGGYWTGPNGGGTQYYNADGEGTKAWDIGEDTTLYACWTADAVITFTVTLDLQDGTGGDRSVEVIFGKPLPAVSIPKLTGHSFGGYWTGKNGAGTQYYNADGAGARNWDIGENTMLYAKWTANAPDTYTVTLAMLGGSGGTASVQVTKGRAMPEIIPPSRTGWKFGGYWTGTGGKGTKYYNADGTGAKAWDSAADATLYAYWTEVLYTITFDMQDGAGGTESAEATYGSAMPVITAPTRTGYTFGGYWTATRGGGTQYYDENGEGTRNWGIAGDTTLYAKWTPVSYTVRFDPQSGTGGTESVPAIYGSAMPDIDVPSRTDYTFDGYYSVGEVQYYTYAGVSAKNWDIAADTTLYAKWKAGYSSSRITFDRQGGIGGTESVEATIGSEMPDITVPSITGYIFGGYWTGADGTGTQYYNADGESVKNWNITGNIILYAKWTPFSCTVILDPQNGSGDTSVTVDYGSEMVDISIPTRTGYEFGGYYTAVNGGGTQYYDAVGRNARNWDIIADTTLYAFWRAAVYSVNFNSNGGGSPVTITGNVMGSKFVTFDQRYGELPTPERTGYNFAGWFTTASGDERIWAETTVALAENHTLYAHWAAKTFNVWYNDDNDGGWLSGSINYKTVTYGQPYGALPGGAADFSYIAPGYTFGGWWTALDGGTQVTAATVVTQTDEHSIYVHWLGTPVISVTFTAQSFTLEAPGTARYEATVLPATATNMTLSWSSSSTDVATVDSTGRVTALQRGTTIITARATDGSGIYGSYSLTVTGLAVTVVFDKAGGTGGTDSVTATHAVPMPAIEVPSLEGYNFAGYYMGPTQYYNADGTSAKNSELTSPTTLHAVWSAKTYTVTFEDRAESNIVFAEADKTRTVTYGQPYGALPQSTLSCPDSSKPYLWFYWLEYVWDERTNTGSNIYHEITPDRLVELKRDHVLQALWSRLPPGMNGNDGW